MGWTECENCEGRGVVEYTSPSDNMDVDEVICEECNGKGKVIKIN